MAKNAIIIGAGPAGLTAAYELLKKTDIIPIILEKSGEIGGISKTINFKGNRMDMGPHRFFSKSDRVMNWWLRMMPLEESIDKDVTISYHNKTHQLDIEANQPVSAGQKDPALKMIVIRRLTRIYFLRKFFAYPIQLLLDTLRTLGLILTLKIMVSFLYIRLLPRKPEKNLEDFIINKFGRQLYMLFFKDYTEKVWGVPCDQISAEWGAQRIKGVSLSKAIGHAIRTFSKKKTGADDIGQKETETSLVEQFLYPKHGPGQLWEEVARQVKAMGGQIYLHQDVQQIDQQDGMIMAIHTTNQLDGSSGLWEGKYFFSTMPVQELIRDMNGQVPESVKEIAAGLQYRDFVNVGILLRQLSARGKNGQTDKIELKDNWIYIQERDVKVGRLMIYNNWGTGMIKDPNTVWIGMEYFCNKTDAFWALTDGEIRRIAIDELVKMDLARSEDVLDSNVVRMEKTYPAYFGTYDRFDEIRDYLARFSNLFLIGRNGMHKYNNADHSMLTAMVAVDNICAGISEKANIWSINTESEYHEERKIQQADAGTKQRQPWRIPEEFGNIMATAGRVLGLNGNSAPWWLAGIAICLLELILFKIWYPFANYMPDSYSYLGAAASNADVNMWPVAYSKFLRLLSVFSHSDLVVVVAQYLLLQSSVVILALSVFHLLQPPRKLRMLTLGLMLIEPLPLYMANYISADSLFIAFSLFWLSSLLWIIYRPGRFLLFIQGILLLTCFVLRYNAIYYPLIAGLGIFLSKQTLARKTAGIAFSLALVAFSIYYTSSKMKEVTGKTQFSAFGGWQLANNALYMYQHIPDAEKGTVPKKFAQLERMVREHMDTLARVHFTKADSLHTYFYLWDERGPLVQFVLRSSKKDSSTPYFIRWAREAPLYLGYGSYLIKEHPVEYLRYFVFPNALKFVVPPTEFLSIYNMGNDSVKPLAKNWFGYRRLRVANQARNREIGIVHYLSLAASAENCAFILSLIGCLCYWKRIRRDRLLLQCLLLFSALWVISTTFNTLVAPVVFRYELFILFSCAPFGIYLLYYLYNQE